MTAPTYVIRTTIRPDEEREVDANEYDRLDRLGLLLGDDPDPQVGVFDLEVSLLIDDVNSATRAKLQGLPPGAHTHPMTQIDGTGSTGRALLATTSALEARTVTGAVASDDARLSDARTPTAHTHPLADVTGAVGTTDPRLSDARTPTAHAHVITDLAATGTPSGSTFLRGDGTWSIPPSGGGGAGAASDTVAGIVELATPAEVITGTDALRAVTPAGLAGRTATETRTGIVEMATVAETTTGTDTARAVTPAGVAAALSGAVNGKAPLPIGYLPTFDQPVEFAIGTALDGADHNYFYNPQFKIWPHGWTSVAIPAELDSFTAGGWIGANHSGGAASVDSLIHAQKGGWQSVLSYTTANQHHYFRQLVPNVIGFSRGIYTMIADVETNGTIACDFYLQGRVNVNDAERELLSVANNVTLTGAGRRLVAVAFQVPDLYDNPQTWDDRSMLEAAFRAISTASGSRTVKLWGLALVGGRVAKRPGASLPGVDQVALESYYETGYFRSAGLDTGSGQKGAPVTFHTHKALPVAASDIVITDFAGNVGKVSTYNLAGTRTDNVAYTAIQGDATVGDSYRDGFVVLVNGTGASGFGFTWEVNNY